METKNVYLSIPISGRPLQEVVAEGVRIVKELKRAHPDWNIINPLKLSADLPKDVWDLPERQRYAKFMGRDVEALLGEADAIYFVHGWADSNGCQIEYAVAKTMAIPCIFTGFGGIIEADAEQDVSYWQEALGCYEVSEPVCGRMVYSKNLIL